MTTTHPTTPDQGDERRASLIEELAAKYSSLDDYGQTVFPEGQWDMFVADLATEPATSREFTNELGNAIRITIEGPTSVSENILTPMEVGQLRGALNEHGTMSLDEAYERLGWAKPKTAAQPVAQPVVDQKPASASDNASCGAQVSYKPVAQEAIGAVRHVAVPFMDGMHAQAFLNPAGEQLPDRTSLYAAPQPSQGAFTKEELEVLASAVGALNFTKYRCLFDKVEALRLAPPHPPVSAEAGKGVAGQCPNSSACNDAQQCLGGCEDSESVAVSGEVSDEQIEAATPAHFGSHQKDAFAAGAKWAVLALAGSAKEAAALERMARLDDEMGIEP